MEGQSKKASLIEVITNVVIGYTWAVLTQVLIFPLFGIFIPISTNIMLGLVFTVSSVIRSYIIRRFFNRIQMSRIKKKGKLKMNFNSIMRKNNKKIVKGSKELNREFWLFRISKRPLINDGFYLVLDNNEFWWASQLDVLINSTVVNRMPNTKFLTSIDLGASLGQMRSSEGLKITSNDITNKYGVSPLGTYFGSISENMDAIKREFPEFFI